MEKPVERVYQTLQKLIGLHRQLLDTVRSEHEALVQAELKGIEDATFAKQALIQAIQQAESERLKALSDLVVLWKKPMRELTLANLAIEIQGTDPKGAEQLRTAFNALSLMIKRIGEQNTDNQALVDKCLEHIHEMKKNVLSEAQPKAETYTQQGKKSTGSGGARIISKEA